VSLPRTLSYKETEQVDENIKKKAHAWQDRLDEVLDRFLAQEKVTRPELINILWDFGIMGRVDPKDPKEKAARKKVGSDIWEGDREAPDLYWRILYSVVASINALKNDWSIMIGHGPILGIANAVGRICYLQDREKCYSIFPEYEADLQINPYALVFDDLVARAKDELKKRGQEPPDEFIPVGAKGSWHNIEFTVDMYTWSGHVWPKVKNIRDHMAIFDNGGGDGIPPEELDPKDFSVPIEEK